jgi:meromycolic acid enoyl-[acyl-carrier-protein] reductase
VTGLLAGKRLLVTGVLTESSLASAVVRAALDHGADVLLTAPLCRALALTARVAPRLGVTTDVLELDVSLPEDLAGLADAVRAAGWDRVDGVLHAMAYVPGQSVGGTFSAAPWDDVAQTLQATTWSLAALVHAVRPLLPRGASVVGLDLDASRAWPTYDWLGVAHAGLEATARYLARELGPDGVRVNLVASGPVRTMTTRAVPGFDELAVRWQEQAPLGWDPADATAVGTAVVTLLSDLLPATTGTVLHVDGGFHAVG